MPVASCNNPVRGPGEGLDHGLVFSVLLLFGVRELRVAC